MSRTGKYAAGEVETMKSRRVCGRTRRKGGRSPEIVKSYMHGLQLAINVPLHNPRAFLPVPQQREQQSPPNFQGYIKIDVNNKHLYFSLYGTPKTKTSFIK